MPVTCDLRYWMTLTEALMVGTIADMHSDNTTEVFNVTSLHLLDRLIQQSHYKDLRGVLTDNTLHVWDAAFAAHGAYERAFGDDGSRIMLQGGGGHYNISYYEQEETPDAIKASPVFRRLFTPDMLQAMQFETLDDFL